MKIGLSRRQTAVIIVAISAIAVFLLWAPGWAHRIEVENILRMVVAAGVLVVFVYLGFQVVANRAGVGVALFLFTVGLAVELLSFAYLYQRDGVLCAVVGPKLPQETIRTEYEKRNDLMSCMLLSVHVWTSVGYGSYMAMPRQGWLTGIEMLMGYAYMAIFIAILVAVLQQYFARDNLLD